MMRLNVLLTLLFLGAFAVACGDDATGGNGNGTGDGLCGNGVIDDGETCDDSGTVSGDGCSSTCQSEEICNDIRDNDGDGLNNCDDPDCSDSASCQGDREVCDDAAGADEDDDGDANCDDSDCATDPACTTPDEICDDAGGVDEDEDGDVNCDDSDCADDPACSTPDEICDDVGGVDEDEDGDVNCDDSDCADDPACEELSEVCDDEAGADEDEDGDANCDDSDCVADPACLCGNAAIDDGEECDEGFALNDDRAPNRCRTDCSWPICGDDVVDFANPDPLATVPNEQCDDADDANCNAATCQFEDIEMACGEDLDATLLDLDFAVADRTDTYRVTGRILGTTSNSEPLLGCTPLEDDGVTPTFPTGEERVFIFQPTTTGTFVARTDLPGTNIDTVVSVRTDCTSSFGEICSDDTLTSLASRLFWDATGGATYYIVVDTLDADTGDFELVVKPAVGAATLGESCNFEDTLCEEGTCGGQDGQRICLDPTPVLSTLTLQHLTFDVPPEDCGGEDAFVFAYSGTGVDADQDADTFEYAFVDSLEGQFTLVLGVDQDPLLADAAFRQNGENFEFHGILFNGATGTIFAVCPGDLETMVDAVSFAGTIVDQNGNESNQIVVDLSTFDVAPLPDVESDPCPAPAWTDWCVLGGPADTACQVQEGGGTACTTGANAPEITTASVTRLNVDDLRIDASGTDLDGDVSGLRIEIWAGDEDLTADIFGADNVFGFPLPPVGQTDWSGQLTFTFTPPLELFPDELALPVPTQFRLSAVDWLDNESGQFNVDLPPARTLADVGDSCDPSRVADSYCFPNLVCQAEGPSGEFVCDEPVLQLLDFAVAPAEDFGPTIGQAYLAFVLIEADAYDVPGEEIVGVIVNSSVGDQVDQRLRFIFDDTAGENLVGGFLLIEANDDINETHFEARGFTLDGQVTNTLRAAPDGLSLETQACDPALLTSVCELGTTCGVSSVCAAGTAPTLTAATLSRETLREIVLSGIEGTDTDGDVVAFRASLNSSDGGPFFDGTRLGDEGTFFFIGLSGQTYGFDASFEVFGLTTFEGDDAGLGQIVLDLGAADCGDGLCQDLLDVDLEFLDSIDLTLYDAAGLESGVLSMDAFLDLDDTGCEGAGGILCRPPLVCSGDTCVNP